MAVGRRTRGSVLTAVLAVVLAGVSGCGEQSSSAAPEAITTHDATTLLPALVAAAEEQGTVHGTAEAEGALIEGDVLVGSEPPEADVTMTVTIDEADPWSVRMVRHGEWVYLSGPDGAGFERMAPDDERLTGAAAGRMHEDVDPVEALARMQAGLTDVEHVGAAEIDGTPVEHYRLTVDHSGEDATASGLAMAAEGVVYDVYADGSDLLRRFTWSTPRGNEVTHDFTGWGDPVEVAAPPADQVRTD